MTPRICEKIYSMWSAYPAVHPTCRYHYHVLPLKLHRRTCETTPTCEYDLSRNICNTLHSYVMSGRRVKNKNKRHARGIYNLFQKLTRYHRQLIWMIYDLIWSIPKVDKMSWTCGSTLQLEFVAGLGGSNHFCSSSRRIKTCLQLESDWIIFLYFESNAKYLRTFASELRPLVARLFL